MIEIIVLLLSPKKLWSENSESTWSQSAILNNVDIILTPKKSQIKYYLQSQSVRDILEDEVYDKIYAVDSTSSKTKEHTNVKQQ